MTSLRLNYVALTDVGLRRSTNQDSGYASSTLIAIADGMGGAAAGDLASATAMNIVKQVDTDLSDVDPLEALGHAVAAANTRLGQLVRDDPSVEGMGTTLEAMLWDGHRFATAHIGDSRAYLLRDGKLTQISADHTFVQSLVDEGKLTPAEARVHPHRSLLLRVMLGRDDNDPDLGWFEGRLGDRFLLCSDGLSDMVEDAVIERLLGAETIDQAATELVRHALEAGGYDNVTVVIGELLDASEEPDEHLSSFDGQPQLVGAASEGPRGRTGRASSGRDTATSTPEVTLDPEELRYAPREPSRFFWVRPLAFVAAFVGVLLVIGVLAYQYTQRQFYVGTYAGQVVIYRGIDVDLPGITLQHVEEGTGVSVSSLPDSYADKVRAGITDVDSLKQARETVAELKAAVPEVTPSPTPSPSTRPSSKASPKASSQAA